MLAQSDIQVTLEESNKTRLDEAGGSLQVVTGSTEGAFQVNESKEYISYRVKEMALVAR